MVDSDIVCVLGSTGNVGRHVVRNLIKRHSSSPGGRGLVVRAASRSPVESTADPSATNGVRVVPVFVNLEDRGSISAAFQNASKVFVVLPQCATPEQMVEYSKVVTDIAVDAKVKQIVRIAAAGIDGLGEAPQVEQGKLGNAHVEAETYIRSFQVSNGTVMPSACLALTSIRPTSFNTNFLKYDAPSIKSTSGFSSPLGIQAKVNWVDCRDIGAVAACALLESGHEGKVYDVTGPADSSLDAPTMASLLSELLARKVTYQELSVPADESYGGLWKFLRAGGFDISTNIVERVTGSAPISFKQFVDENLHTLQ